MNAISRTAILCAADRGGGEADVMLFMLQLQA
jgi:hypothetical protein